MAISADISQSRLIKHPSGRTSHCVIDDFTDPWQSSEAILIQHGFARHYAFFYHWIPTLAKRYKLIRRDLPGHGLSSVPEKELDLDGVLDDIVDTLDQLGVDQVHFVGESTSGMLAEILATKYSERLKSLTVCSSPSYLPQAALDLFAFGHKDWPTACLELGSKGWAESLSRVPGTASGDPEYMKWWIDQVGRSPAAGLATYAKFLSTLDSRPFLGKIGVKTLILAPARSAATKLEEQQWIQSQIPDAKLVVIDAPGHEIYQQEPEKCLSAILDFIAGLK